MKGLKIEQLNKSEQDKNIFAFIEQVKNFKIKEINTTFNENSVRELISKLNETKLFLLGETHGVKENVNIIYTLFKKFGFKVLALEWDKKLQIEVENFLQTGKFNFKAIQNSSDGRITAGHFALLKKLKAEKLLEKVVCFDEQVQSGNWDDRDKSMAENIMINISKSKMIAVAGNFHTKLEPIFFDGKTHHPLGENIKNQIPNVPSGLIQYLTGQYYNYGIKNFKNEHKSKKFSNSRFYKSNEGIYTFELNIAHTATVPNLNEALEL